MFAPTAHTKKGREIVRRLRQDWTSLDFDVDDSDSAFNFREVIQYSSQTELSRRRILVSAGHPSLVCGSAVLRAYVKRIEGNTVYARVDTSY